MKIVTYWGPDPEDKTPFALALQAATAEEFAAMSQEERDSWDEWVWQDQPSKEAAIDRHDDAFEAWQADNESGRPIKETY